VRPAGAGAAALALVAGGLLAGCASGTTLITDPPLCGTGGHPAGTGVVLMAQSVPSASWIPCIRTALPLGWNFHELDARNGRSAFSLDSDRDGSKALTVRLDATCDTAGATQIPSDRPGMSRLERVHRVSPRFAGERYYVFPGGCVTCVFSLAGDNAGEGLALASDAVGVVARSDLRNQVREESGGRLSLDPPGEAGTP
jgi:hypothetical protein